MVDSGLVLQSLGAGPAGFVHCGVSVFSDNKIGRVVSIGEPFEHFAESLRIGEKGVMTGSGPDEHVVFGQTEACAVGPPRVGCVARTAFEDVVAVDRGVVVEGKQVGGTFKSDDFLFGERWQPASEGSLHFRGVVSEVDWVCPPPDLENPLATGRIDISGLVGQRLYPLAVNDNPDFDFGVLGRKLVAPDSNRGDVGQKSIVSADIRLGRAVPLSTRRAI